MVSVRSEEGEGEAGRGTEAATASSPHATRPDGNRAGHTASTHKQIARHLPAPPGAATAPHYTHISTNTTIKQVF